MAGVGKTMDADLAKMKDVVDERFSLLGLKEGTKTAEKVIEFINKEDFKAGSGTNAPMAEVKV
jgi:hypothetical protein